jgi:hypothetical protein
MITENLIGKDGIGSNCGLICGIILIFAWRDREKLRHGHRSEI